MNAVKTAIVIFVWWRIWEGNALSYDEKANQLSRLRAISSV